MPARACCRCKLVGGQLAHQIIRGIAACMTLPVVWPDGSHCVMLACFTRLEQLFVCLGAGHLTPRNNMTPLRHRQLLVSSSARTEVVWSPYSTAGCLVRPGTLLCVHMWFTSGLHLTLCPQPAAGASYVDRPGGTSLALKYEAMLLTRQFGNWGGQLAYFCPLTQLQHVILVCCVQQACMNALQCVVFLTAVCKLTACTDVVTGQHCLATVVELVRSRQLAAVLAASPDDGLMCYSIKHASRQLCYVQCGLDYVQST